MALAIRLQDMVDRGKVRDYAEVALLGHVSRARITQLMNLLHLAPDIQEQLLFPTLDGLTIQERHLRNVVKLESWHDQRQCIRQLLESVAPLQAR